MPFALLHSVSAVVSQKGDSCSPVPEGECQCTLSFAFLEKGSIGIGVQD